MMRYIVVETYFIGRTIGVNCEQRIEFAPKIKKNKPNEMDLPFLNNDITGSEPTVKMLDK
jgi:hypothetical protein